MTSIIDKIYPKTQQVVDLVLKEYPMQKKNLRKAKSNLDENENQEVESYIDFLITEGHKIETIAEAYTLIVRDTFREEFYFREKGKYRYSLFSEVEELVYNNHDYMKLYMIGLGLTVYWWPNHVQLRRFFIANIKKFKAQENDLYREVGPGNGIYFLQAMKNCCFKNYEGIDISPTSVELTKRLLGSGFFGDFSKANIIEDNFLDKKERDLADFLVMGEVLEHVENPDEFIKTAYKTTKDTALVFLTTCINSPAIDHLYNPGTIENLEKLFTDNSFVIRERCIVPRVGKSEEECIKEKLAINVGYFLSKN